MWLFKRGKEMPMVAMAAASIPQPLDTFSCRLVSSYWTFVQPHPG